MCASCFKNNRNELKSVAQMASELKARQDLVKSQIAAKLLAHKASTATVTQPVVPASTSAPNAASLSSELAKKEAELQALKAKLALAEKRKAKPASATTAEAVETPAGDVPDEPQMVE